MGNSTICVVMSTYNGEKYLREQIDSLFRQKGVSLRIYVRDDGSKDSTTQILESYSGEVLTYKHEENCGAKLSFLKALYQAPQCDYYAFSDQDDVWDDDKLVIAINEIQKLEIDNPGKCVLYKGKTRLVDEKMTPFFKGTIDLSPLVQEKPFLRGQSRNSAGCTMVFNSKLREQIIGYMPKVFPMHDAWVNDVCLAVGGIVICDSNPHINYRQHAGNVVGGKRNIFSSLKRRISFYRRMGRCYHSKMYQEIIENYADEMPSYNIARYKFIFSYKNSLKNRIKVLLDKEFMNGDAKFKIEQTVLILFNGY